MKRAIYATLALLLPLFMVACGGEGNKPDTPPKPNSNPNPSKPKTSFLLPPTEVHALPTTTLQALADEHLGRGFNLLTFGVNEAQGVSAERVLKSDAIKPLVKMGKWANAPLSYVQTQTIESLVGVEEQSPLRAFELDVIPYQVDKKRGDIIFVQSRLYNAQEAYLAQGSNLAEHLTDTFTKDLATLSALRLVKKYGTHLVSHIKVGNFLSVAISTNTSIYSSEEIRAIADAYFEGKMLDKIAEKVGQKQGISANIKASGTIDKARLFSPNNGITEAEWGKQISDTHVALWSYLPLGAKHISIPSLIADTYLRTKYIVGILEYQKANEEHFAQEAVLPLSFYLCSANGLEQIKQDGTPITVVGLPKFDSSRTGILKLQEGKALTTDGKNTRVGASGNGHWVFELAESGKWSIKSQRSGLYLCTDLQLRSEKDATEALRYFYFNPILPDGQALAIK